MDSFIRVTGARLHNLKNVSLSLPKNKLVVLTGLSGSGKSTLAFDTLHREGQRQYLESLGMVTGFVSKPAVDSITGLSPSISVDQHLTNRSPRSTVGTVTEVFTYLRLLWSRVGVRPCPGCGKDIPPSHANAAEADTAADEDAEAGQTPCPHCGTLVPELVMGSFSFNKPAGACPECTGLGEVIRPDVRRLVDGGKPVAQGAVKGWNAKLTEWNIPVLRAAAAHYRFTFDADRPVDELGIQQRDLLLHGVESPEFRRHFPDAEPPVTVSAGRFEGVATALLRRYTERADDPEYRERAEQQGLVKQPCGGAAGPGCGPRAGR